MFLAFWPWVLKNVQPSSEKYSRSGGAGTAPRCSQTHHQINWWNKRRAAETSGDRAQSPNLILQELFINGGQDTDAPGVWTGVQNPESRTRSLEPTRPTPRPLLQAPPRRSRPRPQAPRLRAPAPVPADAGPAPPRLAPPPCALGSAAGWTQPRRCSRSFVLRWRRRRRPLGSSPARLLRSPARALW